MNWVDRFFTFFREIEPALAVILDASSCREGWLQGECYRHFRTDENGFEVNHRHRAAGVPFDLYCRAPSAMVAELKVYGQWGYYNKNLHGRNRDGRIIGSSRLDGGSGARGNSSLCRRPATLTGTRQ